MPSTASGGGLSAASCTPGTRQRRGGSTLMSGSNWSPSPSASGRQRPPPRQSCAPFPRSDRSGRWRWAGNCRLPSTLRQKPHEHTQPLCTRSSVHSAAPSCGVWENPQGPKPPRAKSRNTPPELARRHHQDRSALPNTAHACPAHHGRWQALEEHHTDRRTLQEPEGHCGPCATTHRRTHAARAPQRAPTDGDTTRHP